MASATERLLPILGFGSPLVDLYATVSGEFLRDRIPGGKGGTLHVTAEELEELVSALPEPPKLAPGGSAGNTVSALNRLGMKAELLGKAGDDVRGRFFRERFQAAGGEGRCIFTATGEATGVCLTLITPDGERTMRSCLGVSLELNEAELAEVELADFSVVLVEGYMIDAPVFDAVLRKARAAERKIAFDPGSFELAALHRERFMHVLEESADILLVNRAEAESLCGKLPPEKLIEALGARCPCVVLKLGADGALIKGEDEAPVAVPAVKVEKAVDTTAAGDMFAAGFLFGYNSRRGLRECGELGALLASEVVQVAGTELPDAVWQRLKCRFAAR